MINKIDNSLIKILAQENNNKSLECIVFLENFEKSLEILERNQALKVKILGKFPFIGAVSLSVKKFEFESFLRENFVKYAMGQANVFALMNIAKKVLNTPQFCTGEGVTIAYIDTGIAPHLDFTLRKNRIIKFIDLINNRVFPYDDNGHGTFVAGVGSGSGFISKKKFEGIAPRSNIISIKALNKNGEASSSKILEAMQWIFDNHKKFDIKVVCMSFGSEPLGLKDPIMKGAEELWEQGITVVAAAGNSGPDYETIKSPGVSPKIITVGGFNDNRIDEENFNENFFEVAEFSSRGPALKRFKPDVIAPSVNIHSCSSSFEKTKSNLEKFNLFGDYDFNLFGENKNQTNTNWQKFYTTLSGTSVATPMIAGLCALAYEIKPNIKPQNLKDIILQCSKAITYNNNVEGFGIPNALEILNSIKI